MSLLDARLNSSTILRILLLLVNIKLELLQSLLNLFKLRVTYLVLLLSLFIGTLISLQHGASHLVIPRLTSQRDSKLSFPIVCISCDYLFEALIQFLNTDPDHLRLKFAAADPLSHYVFEHLVLSPHLLIELLASPLLVFMLTVFFS